MLRDWLNKIWILLLGKKKSEENIQKNGENTKVLDSTS